MLHAAKAFEIASENDFARNILLRATQEEPNLTPHLEFKNVLVTSSPAGFIQPLNNTRQIVWQDGFIDNGEIVPIETAETTLKALYALAQGIVPKSCTVVPRKRIHGYGFHAPDPLTYHTTIKGPGLCSLPEEDDVFEIYELGDEELENNPELKILKLKTGDVTGFADDLIHGRPLIEAPGQDRGYVAAYEK